MFCGGGAKIIREATLNQIAAKHKARPWHFRHMPAAAITAHGSRQK